MRDYRDSDLDDFSYSRPSVSAWIAVVAVAFAFFMAGGLIKTYRQLEEVREENRREIQELRQTVKKLQGTAPEDAAAPVRPSGRRSRPLPQATRVPRERVRPETDASPRRAAGAERPSGTARAESLRPYPEEPEGEDDDRPKVSIGRKSPVDAFAAQRANMQVIAVSTAQKRVIVEGGRNVGLSEGTRLELTRRGGWIGDLRVIDVYDDKAACEVLHANQTPEAGDGVRVAP